MEKLTASDLRIGNYANYKFWNPFLDNPNWQFSRVEIVGVLKDTFYFKTENDQRICKIGELYPIPITEDILLKLGFEYRTDTGFDGWYSKPHLGESIRIYQVENGWFKYAYAHNVIKYVHQLQNLSFALTGKELNFNQ